MRKASREQRKIFAGITKIGVLFSIAVLALTGCSQSKDSGSEGRYQIGISQLVSHPSLDEAREGFMEAFDEAGIDADFDVQNAQNDQATATSIANKFATSDKDLVLAIATTSAQATVQVIPDIPVLFTAVTDPVAAELVNSLEAPGGNVTGTSDMNPVAQQMSLFRAIDPNIQKVGVVYSSGEVNSYVQVEMARKYAEENGLQLEERTISTTADLAQAVNSLDVEAIYVPTDNRVVAGLETVLAAGEQKHIPVVCGEQDSVAKGCIATWGINYRQLGKQTGEMAIRILTQGADPATTPVELQNEFTLVLNAGAAERMGVVLPEELLKEASEVLR